MNILFDTSVLVPALVDQLANHPVCFDVFSAYTSGQNKGFCSSHAIAECYSVLTALPLPVRISTMEARMLIEESIVKRVKVVQLTQTDYMKAVAIVANKGLSSGIIYDALHIRAGEKAKCTRIYTYNTEHFKQICGEGIQVTAP